ncbi:MAG: hypothetical protein ACE5KM_08735 [Planctomycetaceae bacterium]
MQHRPVRAAAILTVALCCSCGKEETNRKPTFPVTGRVTVDGKAPGSPIAVKCHPVDGMDKQNPTISSAFTAEGGKFEISTYNSGDGIPEGQYVLTFYWGKHNPFTMNYGGPDKLKNRYKNPKTSKFKITVKAGEPTDLGRIDLKTK